MDSGRPMRKEPWIGLAEVRVRPPADPLDGAPGAFVNVLALVRDEEEFRELVASKLYSLDLNTVEIKDIERLRSRIEKTGVIEEVMDLASRLNNQDPVQFDEFQAFGH